MSRLISKFDAIRFPLIPKKSYLKYQAQRASRKGEQELGLLRFLVPGNRNAIDGGAHKGIYSYYLSKICNQVYAYEPNPTMYAYLKSAVPENVVTYETALSDYVGKSQFSVPTSPGRYHHTQGSLMGVTGSTGAVQIDVDVKTIDSYKLDDVGFIKLDLEGHELAALKGGLELLDNCRPVILAEATGVGGSSPEELVQFMVKLNYCPLVFNDGRLKFFGEQAGNNITHNCIFMPNES